MKFKIFLTALLGILSFANAQTPLPANDQNLINLQTPTLLGDMRSSASLDLRYFGGYNKTPTGDFSLGYGICKYWEVDLAGSFSKWNSANLGGGEQIRFGGTDEELSIRYQIPIEVPVTLSVGESYTQTPAQPRRLATTFGGSVGYSPIPKIRLYLNPKAVLLDHNGLVGISFGAAVDVAPNLTLMGDWTPLIAGENTFDTQTGGRSRGQIYSVGLRLSNLFPHGTLDVGVTNSSGITTGSSLTPSLGESPSLFARFTYRF
jgi:hypothetical protein